MTLLKNPGVNGVARFDQVFSQAYDDCNRGTTAKHEPHFVRQLFSRKAIRNLNRAASIIYKSGSNSVKFRGVFLHNSPYAAFSALNQNCRRELADAMFVLYETIPLQNGLHTVIRRSACMLMFKRSGQKHPSAPSFDPLGVNPPKGTDQEQFYLFNQWPRFDLQTGSRANPKSHGFYDIQSKLISQNSVDNDIGKYALLWDRNAAQFLWQCNGANVHWLAGEPIPNFKMDPSLYSLGQLLDSFIDGKSFVGREFSPGAPFTNDWDALLSTLLGYPSSALNATSASHGILQDKEWGKAGRDVNPARLGLMSVFDVPIGLDSLEVVDASIATYAQHSRDFLIRDDLPIFFDEINYYRHSLNDFMCEPPRAGDRQSADEKPFPVLIATVSKFRPDSENQEFEDLPYYPKWRAGYDAYRRAGGVFHSIYQLRNN